MPTRVILPAKIRRKHHLNKRNAIATMRNSGMPVIQDNGVMMYRGRDASGRLTRIGVIEAAEDPNTLVIVHAQPLEWSR